MTMYKKTLQTKVVRTFHEINLRTGIQAVRLKEALSNVPDSAEIVDISCCESDGITVISFKAEEPVQ